MLYDSLLNSTVIYDIAVPVNSHANYNEYGRCKEAVYDRVFEMSLVILSYITMRSLLIDICKYRHTYEKSYNCNLQNLQSYNLKPFYLNRSSNNDPIVGNGDCHLMNDSRDGKRQTYDIRQSQCSKIDIQSAWKSFGIL